jgi:hypothetical protein
LLDFILHYSEFIILPALSLAPGCRSIVVAAGLSRMVWLLVGRVGASRSFLAQPSTA